MADKPIDLAAVRRQRARSALKTEVTARAAELGLDLAQPELQGVCLVPGGVYVSVQAKHGAEQIEDLVCALLNARDRSQGTEGPNLGLGYDPYHSVELDELRELIAKEFGGIADQGYYFDRVKEVATELRALRASAPNPLFCEPQNICSRESNAATEET
jgi:hypothetical protein